MKREDNILYLKEKYPSLWVKSHKNAEMELSDSQYVYCCCGILATGLHEMNCPYFQKKVDSITLKRLSHLIK